MDKKPPKQSWLDRWFFVKEKKPRIIIALVALVCGLAVGIGLDLYRRANEAFFLNRYGWLAGKLLRFVITLGVGMIVLLLTCGVYNLWIRVRKGKVSEGEKGR